jgi:Ion channel
VRACLRFHLETDLENDFPATNRCGRSTGVDYPHYPVWRSRCTHHLDKKYSQRDSGGAGVSLRRTRYANHDSCHLIILHGIVILLWASCYRWLCLPSWESAFYFSASSYATVGYGDVVLRSKWRLLGPLESMVGMLMSGVSIGLLFAAVTHLVDGKSPSRLPLYAEATNADEIRIRQRRHRYLRGSRSDVSLP